MISDSSSGNDHRRDGALRLATALVALVAMAAAAVGIPGWATERNRKSGDEPHYLVTAISLAEDGDLDVADELAARRERPFHRDRLLPQAAEGAGGRMVVPHDPLFPALLSLPVRVGGWLGAQLLLVAVAGALGALVVWVQVRRFGVAVGTATVVATVFVSSAPLAVYGHQLYPEIPAALAVLGAVAALMAPVRSAGRWTGAVVLTAAVVALPWLSVKYIPVAAVLAGVGIGGWWRRGERRGVAGFVALLVVAGVAHVATHLAWYGGLTPYAAGSFFQEQGGQLSVVGSAPYHPARVRRLLALLTDRGFGLAAWQPAWVLAVAAVVAVARAHRHRLPLLAPLAAGWLVATFLAVTMHGWWFPGRQVVVVLPLAVVAVGWWADGRRARLGLVVGTGLLGVATYALLAWETATARLTWVVDFLDTANPWYGVWRWALPDERDLGAGTWVRYWVWLLVAGALAWWGWRAASLAGNAPSPRRGDPRGLRPHRGARRGTADLDRGRAARRPRRADHPLHRG